MKKLTLFALLLLTVGVIAQAPLGQGVPGPNIPRGKAPEQGYVPDAWHPHPGSLMKYSVEIRFGEEPETMPEGMKFGRELVMRGAEERLSPILMTALATGLALLPIVMRGMRPGQEIEHPMAVVILGGLITSTLLNLYVIPTLFLHYGNRKTGARLKPELLP